MSLGPGRHGGEAQEGEGGAASEGACDHAGRSSGWDRSPLRSRSRGAAPPTRARRRRGPGTKKGRALARPLSIWRVARAGQGFGNSTGWSDRVLR
ncbi:hypothetical protein VQ02_31805 [Methylobacterium variabile]|uniref:Uncharacterized protein n=1 Tax=Methylobacterium variabile TaxID=298794 RepID=A0A0J6S3T1_9HYPH|nr:hypothetical protein VQ02_31805 [Methylobacterium variabile]